MASTQSRLERVTEPDDFGIGCDLVPVPAAHVIRAGSGFAFKGFNASYRQAGLGTAARSPLLEELGDRIDSFLTSSATRCDFNWAFGDAIDCRHYRVTLARNALSDTDRCAITLVDQTSQFNTERSLRREMTTDSLTGLPNREGFSDMIEAIDPANGRIAVLVVDLARFGRFNACLGALSGDELLITVARRIRSALRASDSIARIGGDEFGIIATIDGCRDEADQLADRIRRSLTVPFRLTDYEIGVECSVGIAIDNDDILDREELIRNAQFAAKRAKLSGQIEFYHPQSFSIARAQFAMETALRRAVEGDELKLYFQPICDLATDRIVSFEALARWRDRDGIDHSPNDFIPVAEESGLIVPLGRWAIDQAVRTLADWDAAVGGNCGVRLAVNVSAVQLQRDDIVAAVESATELHGVKANRLTLELTESAIVTDPDRIAVTMRALRDLGATLAMDDFGTGYSNLAYLQKLPIDVLKIDRSFVTNMLTDRDNVAIVRAVLSLAQALGMRTTAEGIETAELGRTLAALGCSYGQGFVYSRPVDAAAAFAMLAPASSSAI